MRAGPARGSRPEPTIDDPGSERYRESRKRARKPLYVVLTILSGTLLGLLLVEGAARIVPFRSAPNPLAGDDPTRAIFCQYHAVLGYSGIPGFAAPWRWGSDPFVVKLNSQGSRDAERAIAPTGDRPRVVFLGDSFVWGYGVRDAERLSERLEAHLRPGSGAAREAEAINLGVSGYGTDQAILSYLLLGERYAPRAVVLVFYSENDPYENAAAEYWNCPKPVALRASAGLVLANVPVPRVAGWANNRLIAPTSRLRAWGRWSRLMRVLAERELPLPLLSTDASAPLAQLARSGFFAGFAASKGRRGEQPTTITIALLDRFRRHLEARDVELVLLLVPSLRLDPASGSDEARHYEAVRAWAAASAVPHVDYLAASRDELGHQETLYSPSHLHWTARGHDFAAKLLAARLEPLLGSGTEPEAASP